VDPVNVAEIVAFGELSYLMIDATVVYRSQPVGIALLSYSKETSPCLISDVYDRFVAKLWRLRYISYQRVEEACRRLRRALLRQIGREALASAVYVGIPRGGLTILGVLSYILDLRHDQLRTWPDGTQTVIVTDDCAVTGARFAHFLKDFGADEVIFAPLFSNPTLREEIVRQESKVTACVSGYDLEDRAPEELGDNYEEWRQFWTKRRSGYWVGRTDHLCFPWGEVDSIFWDESRQSYRPGPPVVPPNFVLKRPHALRDGRELDVFVQPEAAGPIKPLDTVFFGTIGKSTIVANPDADVCIELQDTAAAIWHAIIEKGTRDRVVDSLLDEYDIKRLALSEHVDQFIEQLEEIGLLEVTTT